MALTTLVLALTSCIQIPDESVPQCYSDNDCNVAAGEVCAEGLCYGDPPTGTFGVSFSGPSTRTDVTSVERASESLPANGDLTDLTLETPVVLTTHVTAASCAPPTSQINCPTGMLAASIALSRPARFSGGDGFHQTQSASDGASISFTLPRTRPGDPAYVITVTPGDLSTAAGSALAPAQLVPPLRTTLRVGSDADVTLAMGSGNLPIVSGTLTDTDGTALTGYRVSAIGRWLGDDADSEVSSVFYTQDGHFQIVLSAGLAGPVTLVAKPVGTIAEAPSLELTNVDNNASSALALVQPAGLGTAQTISLTISGTSSNGAVDPISGAQVIVSATVAAGIGSGSGSAAATGSASAVIEVQATTGSNGVAALPLLDGIAYYHLRVVPPAGSSLAVLDEEAFQPSNATRLLVPRVALAGTVVDVTGERVANMSVTVRPSLTFQWSLDTAAQKFLAQLPAATAVTADNGDFVVFVDPVIATVAATYDLSFEPPSGSSIPSFTVAGIKIPAGTVGPMSLPLATITLPEAAAMRGLIRDPSGVPVPGGELRVFSIPSATDAQALCEMHLPFAPSDCTVPAELQAHATADASGIVRFTLPRRP